MEITRETTMRRISSLKIMGGWFTLESASNIVPTGKHTGEGGGVNGIRVKIRLHEVFILMLLVTVVVNDGIV